MARSLRVWFVRRDEVSAIRTGPSGLGQHPGSQLRRAMLGPRLRYRRLRGPTPWRTAGCTSPGRTARLGSRRGSTSDHVDRTARGEGAMHVAQDAACLIRRPRCVAQIGVVAGRSTIVAESWGHDCVSATATPPDPPPTSTRRRKREKSWRAARSRPAARASVCYELIEGLRAIACSSRPITPTTKSPPA